MFRVEPRNIDALYEILQMDESHGRMGVITLGDGPIDRMYSYFKSSKRNITLNSSIKFEKGIHGYCDIPIETLVNELADQFKIRSKSQVQILLEKDGAEYLIEKGGYKENEITALAKIESKEEFEVSFLIFLVGLFCFQKGPKSFQWNPFFHLHLDTCGNPIQSCKYYPEL